MSHPRASNKTLLIITALNLINNIFLLRFLRQLVTFSFFCNTPVERSSHRRCILRKDTHRYFAKFTGKHLCLFIKKESLEEVFSCEFCEISNNTFFIELLLHLSIRVSAWRKRADLHSIIVAILRSQLFSENKNYIK